MFGRKWRFQGPSAALAIVVCSACAVGTSMVKAPIQERCEEVPLKGCSEIADGAVLFIEGKTAEAKEKLRAGAVQNAPEDVRRFASAVVLVSKLPGVGPYAAPVASIAQFLEADASVSSHPAPSSSPARAAATTQTTPQSVPTSSESAVASGDAHPSEVASANVDRGRADFAIYALTAPVDPTRTETESLGFAQAPATDSCTLAGMSGTCVARRAGPIVVTDLVALSGCPGRLFVASSLSDKPALGLRWFAEATPAGLTGARLFVGGGEWLQVILVPNAKADPHDAHCVVTWSGFRPRMVPVRM